MRRRRCTASRRRRTVSATRARGVLPVPPDGDNPPPVPLLSSRESRSCSAVSESWIRSSAASSCGGGGGGSGPAAAVGGGPGVATEGGARARAGVDARKGTAATEGAREATARRLPAVRGGNAPAPAAIDEPATDLGGATRAGTAPRTCDRTDGGTLACAGWKTSSSAQRDEEDDEPDEYDRSLGGGRCRCCDAAGALRTASARVRGGPYPGKGGATAEAEGGGR